MESDDATLVSRCLERDAAAEYELYNRFAPLMYGICIRYARTDSRALDILQEGFLLVFTRLHLFDRTRDLEAWMARIFINTAIRHYRWHRRYDRFHHIVREGAWTAREEGILGRISANEILELIRNLPSGCRIIFNLFAVEGYTHEEIAVMLGITAGTSKSQVARAKAIIRKKLPRHDKLGIAIGLAMTDGKDPLLGSMKTAMHGMRKTPPASAWKFVAGHLHPVAKPPVTAWFHELFSLFAGKTVHLYITLAVAGSALTGALLWFGTGSRHELRGHAYAGPGRLTSGRVELFILNDRTLPWDSLEHSRSAYIDRTGHFQLARLKPGNYLLRAAPEAGTGEAERFSATWYDGSTSSDSCRIICIDDHDVTVDISLRPNAGNH